MLDSDATSVKDVSFFRSKQRTSLFPSSSTQGKQYGTVLARHSAHRDDPRFLNTFASDRRLQHIGDRDEGWPSILALKRNTTTRLYASQSLRKETEAPQAPTYFE